MVLLSSQYANDTVTSQVTLGIVVTYSSYNGAPIILQEAYGTSSTLLFLSMIVEMGITKQVHKHFSYS